MATYYRNLHRHLSRKEEALLDAIVAQARGNPATGIGYPPRYDVPRVWLEECDVETAHCLDDALAKMGLLDREAAP